LSKLSKSITSIKPLINYFLINFLKLEYKPKKIIVSKRTYPKKIKSKNIIKIFIFTFILNLSKKLKNIRDPSIKKTRVNIIVMLMM
tara:strand:- start:64 stop:321 length:258 start_codon:yes stop_codon:yes gene_type:complete